MYNWLVIFTRPNDDKMEQAPFFNEGDVAAWIEANQDCRALVIYGRIESVEDHQ